MLNPNALESESNDQQEKEAEDDVEIAFRPTERSSSGNGRGRIRKTTNGMYADANNTSGDFSDISDHHRGEDVARVEVELVEGIASPGVSGTIPGTGCGSPRSIANAFGRKKQYSPISAESV